jgi:hypothetical protein
MCTPCRLRDTIYDSPSLSEHLDCGVAYGRASLQGWRQPQRVCIPAGMNVPMHVEHLTGDLTLSCSRACGFRTGGSAPQI